MACLPLLQKRAITGLFYLRFNFTSVGLFELEESKKYNAPLKKPKDSRLEVGPIVVRVSFSLNMEKMMDSKRRNVLGKSFKKEMCVLEGSYHACMSEQGQCTCNSLWSIGNGRENKTLCRAFFHLFLFFQKNLMLVKSAGLTA